MVEKVNPVQEYSINKKKYLQLFYNLCRNSKEHKKEILPNFDESLISKKINQLEQRNLINKNDSDWITKKIHSKPAIVQSKKKVVIVRHSTLKNEENNHKKLIEELKSQVIEAKKDYINLKQKGVFKEHLDSIKKRIDNLEKKLK